MLNLNQLARDRVHLLFAAGTVAWFTLATFLRVLDGENALWAFWNSVKEVKLMEFVSMVCLWIALASLVKENHELRAKVELLTSRQ